MSALLVAVADKQKSTNTLSFENESSLNASVKRLTDLIIDDNLSERVADFVATLLKNIFAVPRIFLP